MSFLSFQDEIETLLSAQQFLKRPHLHSGGNHQS